MHIQTCTLKRAHLDEQRKNEQRSNAQLNNERSNANNRTQPPMAKSKIAFVCTDCGSEHGQWQGQCVACKAWNTLSQINLGASTSPATKADFRKPGGYSGDVSDVQNLSDIDLDALPRFS
ncbi:MAG: hypothetical protein MUQ61_05995, partial [OM182 bacterium]|nr:hypothetical protein [OM182 bacterium]